MKTFRNIYKSVGSLVLSTCLCSCGLQSNGLDMARAEWNRANPPAADQDAETEAEALEIEVEGDDLSGVWAMKQTIKNDLYVIGDPWSLTETVYMLATIDVRNRTFTADFCFYHADVKTGGTQEKPMGTAMPQPTMDKLRGWEFELGADETKGLTAHNVSWLWGLKPEFPDPETATLPTDAANQWVVDEDSDDNPGITLESLSPQGFRYLVRRQISSFTAADMSADKQWIAGKMEAATTESVLGADNTFLLKPSDVRPRAGESRYWLRRVASLEGADGDVSDGDVAEAETTGGDADADAASGETEAATAAKILAGEAVVTDCASLTAAAEGLFADAPEAK